jgi:hypothetical protein
MSKSELMSLELGKENAITHVAGNTKIHTQTFTAWATSVLASLLKDQMTLHTHLY